MKLRNKNTGEIWELWQADTLHEKKDEFYEGDVERICLEMIDEDYDHYHFEYASLKELCKEWEDASAEPLIKDEKIRKAVCAWAAYNGVEEVYYFTDGEGGSRLDAHTVMMGFYDEIDELKGWKKYTIAELCGEEEE